MNILWDTSSNQANCTVTMPYSTTELKFIRPIGIKFTPLEKMLLPFGADVWICLFGTVLIVFVIAHWMSHQSALEIIQIALGGGAQHAPIRISGKLMFATWIISMLIVRTAYQGALFDVLQAQIRYQSVATTADLAKYNYTVYGSKTSVARMKLMMPHLAEQLS